MELDEVLKSNPRTVFLSNLTQEIDSYLVWKTRVVRDDPLHIGYPLGEPHLPKAKYLVKLHRVDGTIVYRDTDYDGFLMFQEWLYGRPILDETYKNLKYSQDSIVHYGKISLQFKHGEPAEYYCRLDIGAGLAGFTTDSFVTIPTLNTDILDLFNEFIKLFKDNLLKRIKNEN